MPEPLFTAENFPLLFSCIGMLTSIALAVAANNGAKLLDVPMKKLSVEFISDIVYSQPSIYGDPNFPLHMDILKPGTPDLLPAVVFVPGGGFMSANKSTFPSPLEDVKSAIRYLRAHADKYGIGPERIAVMG